MSVWNWNNFARLRGHTLIMGILNVTPDSFSDGGQNFDVETAVRTAVKMAKDGADIIDIGGESTRPGAQKISVDDEIARVIPVIEAVKAEIDIPISIDTYKSEVARAALNAGANIVNDISGLTFDQRVANVAAEEKAGLVLMHLIGDIDSMHAQEAVDDIFTEVEKSFDRSIKTATAAGVERSSIALDIGIGFSKSFEQNQELISGLGRLVEQFDDMPMLVGLSRKSFLGKILNGAKSDERLYGTIAANVLAVKNGASIIRVHDVKQHRDALDVVDAIMNK